MKYILITVLILLNCNSYASADKGKFYCEPKFDNLNYKEYNLLYKQESIVGNSQEMINRNLSISIDMDKEVCEILKNEVSDQALAVEWVTIRNNPGGRACKWTSRERRVGFKLSQLGSQLIDGHPTIIWFYPFGPKTEEFEIEVTDPEWDDVTACWP